MKKCSLLLCSLFLMMLLASCETQSATKTKETSAPSEPTILETAESLTLDLDSMLKVIQKKSEKVEQVIVRNNKEYYLSVQTDIENTDEIELYYAESSSK